MFKVINPYNRFIIQVNQFLIKIIEPLLKKIRDYIPPVAGIDLSMIIVFLAIHFTKDVLYTYLYTY